MTIDQRIHDLPEIRWNGNGDRRNLKPVQIAFINGTPSYVAGYDPSRQQLVVSRTTDKDTIMKADEVFTIQVSQDTSYRLSQEVEHHT